MLRRSAARPLRATSLVLVALAAACGGGGGDAEPTPDPNALFRDVSATHLPDGIRGRSCMDVAAADFDGDGDRDLVLAIEANRNVYLRNDGAGVFSDRSAAAGMLDNNGDHEDLARADLDGDGDLDLAFAAEDTQIHEVYLNDSGSFAGRQLAQSGVANAVIAFDVDEDGDQDLLFGGAGLLLLVNDGDGGFAVDGLSRLPAGLGLVTQDLVAGDVDGDGDLDLLLGNEGQNQLLVNDGDGVFAVDASGRLPAVLDETRLMALGDVDGDADIDLYVGNVRQEIPAGAATRNFLYLNDGAGRFAAAPAGSVPPQFGTYGGRLADWDGDGDLDLALANADLLDAATVPAYALYRNDGTGRFDDVSGAAFGLSIREHGFGVEVADVSGDGKPDLYLCSRGALTQAPAQRLGTDDHLLFAR